MSNNYPDDIGMYRYSSQSPLDESDWVDEPEVERYVVELSSYDMKQLRLLAVSDLTGTIQSIIDNAEPQ